MTNNSLLDTLTIARTYETAFPGEVVVWRMGFARVRCPVATHIDRHPSASLNEEKNGWHCWSCQAFGGMLDLVVVAGHAKDHADAAQWLEERLR
jgi:hypothetical protein